MFTLSLPATGGLVAGSTQSVLSGVLARHRHQQAEQAEQQHPGSPSQLVREEEIVTLHSQNWFCCPHLSLSRCLTG